MPRRLYRCYGLGYLHFITSSCYQRRPFLNTPRRRTLLVRILEEVRRRYNFVLVGYVVMPEHIHLIISEPERGTPSTVMQVLKQRFARKVLAEWRARNQSRSPRMSLAEIGGPQDNRGSPHVGVPTLAKNARVGQPHSE